MIVAILVVCVFVAWFGGFIVGAWLQSLDNRDRDRRFVLWLTDYWGLPIGPVDESDADRVVTLFNESEVARVVGDDARRDSHLSL